MSYMLTSSEKKIAREWQKYQGFTVRPLPSTVQYYSGLINSYKNKNHFFMYGGTPEIRSIFSEKNLSVVLTDQSELMVRAMGKLTTHRLPINDNETFINANWLDLTPLKAKFDVIIGDDAINMLEWHHFNKFIENAHRILKPDGIFICHLLVKPDDQLINRSFDFVVRIQRTVIK